MEKIYVIMILAACAGHAATAQTKRIAHRSHSGSRHSFTLKGADDFGEIMRMPEIQEMPKVRVADTVKVIKVKPWKQVRDSMPPAVNPVYTKRKAVPQKKQPVKSR